MNKLFRACMHYLYRLYISPHGADVDSRRREFILNTLLSGLLAIATIALLQAVVDLFFTRIQPGSGGVWQTFIFWIVISSLLLLSRRGKPRLAAYIFITFLLLSSCEFILAWGFRLAQAELVFALTIVIAGVLFRGPLALAAATVAALLLLSIAYLQVHGLQIPQTSWVTKPPYIQDATGYVAVFAIIAIVSWLSNRETDRALTRARLSEADLQQERDNLELKVIERTHELEELQAARLLEMQPFAEFGRIGANLVHDIANPLTAATLNLAELSNQEHSELVLQVQRSLNHLERYLLAARKQIKRESDLSQFSVGAELRQIVHLLSHRAQRAKVKIVLPKIPVAKLYGDVVRFDQLVANLIANAIDASEKNKSVDISKVFVTVTKRGATVSIAVTDHGIGITDKQIDDLFEPFYSTDRTARRGLGLGLAMVKQYVEHDFQGSISVVSGPADGTTFTVNLRGRQRP